MVCVNGVNNGNYSRNDIPVPLGPLLPLFKRAALGLRLFPCCQIMDSFFASSFVMDYLCILPFPTPL